MESKAISWDHRVIGDVNKDPCSEQDQLPRFSQGCVKSDFQYPQSWKDHNSSVQPVSVFNHFHSEKGYLQEFPVFWFVSISSCPVTEHHWKQAGPVSFAPLSGVYAYGYNPP